MPKSKEKLSLFWLARYKPYPTVLISGLLFVLAFPPFPFAFLIYVAFVPLLMVIDVTPERVFEDQYWGFVKGLLITIFRFFATPFWIIAVLIRKVLRKPASFNYWNYLIYKRKIISHNAQVFRYTYITFLIWNLGCCYWLMLTVTGASDLSEGLEYLGAGLAANLVNPFLMAVPIYFYTRVKKITSVTLSSLAFLVFWITFEWFHFNWDLSWAWNTLGHAMTFYPFNIQYIEFTGVLGISVQILLVNVLVYQILKGIRLGVQKQLLYKRGIWIGVVLLVPIVLNQVLLNDNRNVFQPTGSINVRVIQPNIDPFLKFDAQNRPVDQIEGFAKLIKSPGIDTIELVVMPETAIPKGIWTTKLKKDELIQPLWAIVDTYENSLLSGFMEFRFYSDLDKNIPVSARKFQEGYYEVCNASTIFRSDQEPETFQKGKLVPMVERMPFLGYLSFLKNMEIDFGGSFGSYGLPDSIRPLVTRSGAKVGSLICYESEYGDYVREFTASGAEMLTIITNDGWWLNSSGHIQHAHFATLRAIENRREIPRSANTGTSLFADVKGKLHQKTTYWTETYIDRKVNLHDSLTFYVKYGDYLGWLSAIGTVVVLILTYLSFRKKRVRTQSN